MGTFCSVETGTHEALERIAAEDGKRSVVPHSPHRGTSATEDDGWTSDGGAESAVVSNQFLDYEEQRVGVNTFRWNMLA
jgi:hypothetical protein